VTPAETHPIAGLSDEALQALLRRAIRDTLILGAVASLILLIATGWRDAAMMATGAAISAGSVFEWQRLIRVFNAKLDQKKAPRGTATVVGFFLLRLLLFAAAIYGSLKCFQGSAIALLCGVGLAVIAMAFEALRLLKD
jgi:hypothetical protein